MDKHFPVNKEKKLSGLSHFLVSFSTTLVEKLHKHKFNDVPSIL